MSSELDDSSLSVESVGDDENVFFVLNGGDDSGGKHELLPCLLDVDVMNSFRVLGISVFLHLIIKILGSNVGLGSN